MTNWTIRKRITAGFAGVIIITITLGGFSYSRLIKIREHSDRIAKLSLPTIELVAQARRNAIDYDKVIYKSIGSVDKEDKAHLDAVMNADSVDNTKVYEELGKLVMDRSEER